MCFEHVLEQIQSVTPIMLQDSSLKLGKQTYYRLAGVIVHIPHVATDGGHYTSYFLCSHQRQWFYANDSKVRMLMDNFVLHRQHYF